VFLLVACAQKMADQPKYNPLDPSAFFGTGASATTPVPGTVARGYLQDDPALFTGKTALGVDVTAFPFPINRADLDRGRERFDIYCAPCHGRVGNGEGLVVLRGFSPPPTFHSDYLRQAPVGHFFDVITNGFGAMPSYGDKIPARDRWLIIAYIRALQLSQYAPVADVPQPIRGRFAASRPPAPGQVP
jgi:mono/diheme cytochrome c family protein